MKVKASCRYCSADEFSRVVETEDGKLYLCASCGELNYPRWLHLELVEEGDAS